MAQEGTLITTTSNYMERVDLAGQVARVERAQEEVRKFVAAQHKLMTEQSQLIPEAASLRIIRFVTSTAAVVAALGSLVAAVPVVAKWIGPG